MLRPSILEHSKRFAIGVTLILGSSVANAETEGKWWYGKFAHEGATSCDTDSFVEYSDKGERHWEGSCKVTKIQTIKGVQAVVIDMLCSQEDLNNIPSRRLVVKLHGPQILSGTSVLSPCEGDM